MGVWKRRISSSRENVPLGTGLLNSNPNPHNFIIESCEEIGYWFLVKIVYPDCKSFEGRKVLVMNKDPRKMTVIDPHFTEGGYIVARFTPDITGSLHAKTFMRCLV